MIEVNEETLKRFIQQMNMASQKEQEEISKILNDSSYMDSLMEKIKANSYVFERGNNNKLSVLYRIINNYARDNSLNPIAGHNYKYFYVKYNDYLFAIYQKSDSEGITYGCFPIHVNRNELPYYLQFDDIKNNKTLDINSFDIGLIAEFRDIVNKMIDNGFNYDFLQQLGKSIMERREKVKQKKLSK